MKPVLVHGGSHTPNSELLENDMPPVVSLLSLCKELNSYLVLSNKTKRDKIMPTTPRTPHAARGRRCGSQITPVPPTSHRGRRPKRRSYRQSPRRSQNWRSSRFGAACGGSMQAATSAGAARANPSDDGSTNSLDLAPLCTEPVGLNAEVRHKHH